MTDLTERLAAKLEAEGFVQFDAVLIGHKAPTILPLLLSEPELVAGLAPEVKVATLKTLIQDMRMQAGYYYSEVDGHLALVCPDPIREGVSADDVRLSVLTPRERAVMKLGEAAEAYAKADDEYGSSDGFQDPLIPGSPLHSALQEFDAALADEATKQVILHKPGTTFRAYAHGTYRTYLVLADGSVQERLTRAEIRQRARSAPKGGA